MPHPETRPPAGLHAPILGTWRSFSDFDTRGYRMVDVPTGYSQWIAV